MNVNDASKGGSRERRAHLHPLPAQLPCLTPNQEDSMTTETSITTWQDLFPDGRRLFYEGDDPEGFRQEILDEFGFDVRTPDPTPNGDTRSGARTSPG